MFSGYDLSFNRSGLWRFDNYRNTTIVGVGNSWSSYADNCKNNFLVVGDGTTFGINGSFGSPEKKISINSSKANRNFVWVCVRMLIKVVCLLKENKYMLTLQLNFVSEVYLEDLVLVSLV